MGLRGRPSLCDPVEVLLGVGDKFCGFEVGVAGLLQGVDLFCDMVDRIVLAAGSSIWSGARLAFILAVDVADIYEDEDDEEDLDEVVVEL